MEGRLVEFAEVLRQNGLRVGTPEVLDAVQATHAIGLEDREAFRFALEATLVKRSSDREAFARAFEFFFSGAARAFEAIDRSLAQRIREEGLLEGDERIMLLATIAHLVHGMSPLASALINGKSGQLAQIFRNAALQLDFSRFESPLQAGFYARRMLAMAGLDAARKDLEGLAQELTDREVSKGGVEIVSRHVAAMLRDLEAAARKEVDRQAAARLRKRSGLLSDAALAALSPSEVAQAQRAVRRLAERLKSRLKRVQSPRRRGTLNVKRTLRRNLPWGGVPMIPQFRRRRPERPEMVILCDLSDSVRNVSRLMLVFMYTLQALYSRVRTFAFVSEVTELTDLFREASLDEAVQAALSGTEVSLMGNSNYGRALASFARRELGSLTRRTTVLVIGDGRNNYNEPNAWALDDIKRRARRLLWVCPEDRYSWGSGDSEMRRYARACDHVAVVRTLQDLENVADQLVPKGTR